MIFVSAIVGCEAVAMPFPVPTTLNSEEERSGRSERAPTLAETKIIAFFDTMHEVPQEIARPVDTAIPAMFPHLTDGK
jgi:hypothetical protein